MLLAALLIQNNGVAADNPMPLPKPPTNRLAFVADGTNGFTFDTGLLRGRLRARGKSSGLTSVVHVPTGAALDQGSGWFGHYRVFTTGKRYGTAAWDWPGDAVLQSDGSVEVRWPAVDGRGFELRAVYRWTAADTLDLETSVRARTNLPKFEVFLASYFSKQFTNSLVYRTVEFTGWPGFMAAEERLGTWLVFPRDDSEIALIRDGRWKLEPNPIDWVLMPRSAKPLGLRRAPGLTVALMAPTTDCSAVSTPHQTESHYSTYLTLFSRDLKPGETASTCTRLKVFEKNPESDILADYDAWVASLPKR
jgi:hypothetical protein